VSKLSTSTTGDWEHSLVLLDPSDREGNVSWWERNKDYVFIGIIVVFIFFLGYVAGKTS
jgi:hypothetical protein